MSDLYISWDEYHHLIETLAVKIYQSDWQFNQLVCLAKGGLRIGDILARLFDQPLAILSCASYGGVNNQTRGDVVFSPHLSLTTNKLSDRILLVDDLVDTGITLHAAINWLKKHHGDDIQQIKTGVIWYKQSSQIVPDYYVEYFPHTPWIHQPFEIYEQITPAELAKRYHQ